MTRSNEVERLLNLSIKLYSISKMMEIGKNNILLNLKKELPVVAYKSLRCQGVIKLKNQLSQGIGRRIY